MLREAGGNYAANTLEFKLISYSVYYEDTLRLRETHIFHNDMKLLSLFGINSSDQTPGTDGKSFKDFVIEIYNNNRKLLSDYTDLVLFGSIQDNHQDEIVARKSQVDAESMQRLKEFSQNPDGTIKLFKNFGDLINSISGKIATPDADSI